MKTGRLLFFLQEICATFAPTDSRTTDPLIIPMAPPAVIASGALDSIRDKTFYRDKSGTILKAIAPTDICKGDLRGAKRNRTAVAGFADLCLTARP